MQSLRAPERPVSHFRNGKLRSEEAPRFDLKLGAKAAAQAVVDMEAEAEDRAFAQAGPQFALRTPSRQTPVAATQLPARIEPRVTRRAEPRDPAPSRLSYRIERLWLTPLFRIIMRVGLPVMSIALVVVVYFGDADRRAAIGARFADLRTQIENRPEFMVKLMSIDGASGPVADAIRKMLPVQLPASSFAIDLEAMRATIEQVDAVAGVSLKVRAGGVLAVAVEERKPAVLWRTAASLEMLDATGHRVATLLDRSARPDLPVIAGEGAESAVPEAMAILTAAQPILPRVRGLIRMGDRRWDIILDRNQRILLPETDPVLATEKAMAIDAAEELLARDLAVIDLRNAERPTLRLTAGAVQAMRELTETETKVAGE